jgi:UMF1 family MFS transporter
MATVFPVYYRGLARDAGIGNADATAAWSYTNAAAMLIVALAGPFLGALADVARRTKLFTGIFAALGMLGSAALALLGDGAWVAATVLFVISTIGFAGSLIFYDSLLPHIAREGDIDRVSAKGSALGYLGGGLLLALNLAWMAWPAWFFMPNREFALRASFVSVAVWWAVFAIPFFRHVPEPANGTRRQPVRHLAAESLRRLGRTFRNLRQYRQLALFLLAFWIYNDGISTVIKIAVAYGDEIGIRQRDLLLALLITQTVAVPCSLLFGPLGRWLGTKRAILLGLAAYAVACPLGFFMQTAAHFFALSVVVGLVQGGTQALSRSLFATMVPRTRSAEFFGFFSTGEKFAGIVGPFLFGVIGQVGGSSRWSILSITTFFIVGAVLLLRVNESEGQRAAAAVDAEHALKLNL